jgi:Fe-S-cluster containining protein
MTDQSSLPAGEFSCWLREARDSLLQDAGADVPCDGCNSCCSSSYFIHVGPQESDALAAIPSALLFSAPGAIDGTLVMGYDKDGACPMLRDGACTIYAHRPIACRMYDCRVFSATGIVPSEAAIAERAQRWEFRFPAEQDHAEFAAVRAAAHFLQSNPREFPEGFLPTNSAQLAVFAIRVYDVFLEADDGVDIGRVGKPAARAAAVVDAAQSFGSEPNPARHDAERSRGE